MLLVSRLSGRGLLSYLNSGKNEPSCKCIKCNGTGYIEELNYYLINGKPVYAQ